MARGQPAPGTGGIVPAARPSARIWFALAAIALVVILALSMRTDRRGDGNNGPESAASGARYGGALACRDAPHFVADLGFPSRSSLSTGEPRKGLVLLDLDDLGHSYQHPTWSEHGYLGPFTYDRAGNVYVAPMPRRSLLDNPPDERNTIYKVDTNSGVMAEFLTVPPRVPPSPQNPFGIMGLTYDCDSGSLYVSSVAGSTRHEELGQLLRIDLAGGEIADRLVDIDALGLAVHNGARGKRLYFGSARRSEVLSVGLTAHGDFDGPARVAFRTPGAIERATDVAFDADGAMAVSAAPFEFTLVAAPTQSSLYYYSYHPGSDAWILEGTP